MSQKGEWTYSTDPFLIKVLENFNKMELFTEDFSSKLSLNTDPAIVAIRNDFLPYRNSYHNKYIAWKEAVRDSMGKTGKYQDLLKDLSSNKAAEIYGAVVNVLHKGTPEFKNVFPHGVKALQEGKYSDRINEVEIIKNRIMAYPALASTVALMSIIYLQLIDAQAKHHSAQKDVRDRSDELEVQRIVIAQQMYKNLGKLISIYFQTPEMIANFFNLTLIRKHSSEQSADVDTFVFTTDQSTLKQITITLKGIAGKVAVVDWDDGDIEEYIYTGGDQTIHHVYFEKRSYDIRIGQDTGELTSLTLNQCNLTHFAWTKGDVVYKMRDIEVAYNDLTHLPSFEGMTDLNYVNIKENNIVTNDLNKTLITLSEGGISGGTFHSDGPDMPTPTGEGLIAKNALIARGWTVVTN